MMRSPTLVLALTAIGAPAWSLDSGESVLVSTRTRASLGVGYGAPLGATATAGVLYGLGADVREESERVKALVGLLFQLHAGTGGGKLSLGLGARASVRSEDFKGSAGSALKLSLVRTWRHPVGTEHGQTYLGPELDIGLWRLDSTLGVLARVNGSRGGRVVFSWGLGLRF
jgi:hypothetical protein